MKKKIKRGEIKKCISFLIYRCSPSKFNQNLLKLFSPTPSAFPHMRLLKPIFFPSGLFEPGSTDNRWRVRSAMNLIKSNCGEVVLVSPARYLWLITNLKNSKVRIVRGGGFDIVLNQKTMKYTGTLYANHFNA